MMKIAIVLTLLSLFGNHVFASTTHGLVKIKSTSCFNPNIERRGSGLAFRYHHQNYILTSEHVILNPDVNESCNFIIAEDQKVQHSKLVLADWATGLALLQTSENINGAKELDLDNDRTNSDELIGQKVVVSGFRFDDTSPSIDQDLASISNSKSYPDLFWQSEGLIQIIHAFGDSGMSGAPIYLKSGEWIGILSHRIPQYQASKKAIITEISSQKAQKYDDASLLVIPKTTVFQFLKRILIEQKDYSEISRIYTPSENHEIVLASQLQFQYEADASQTSLAANLDGGDPVGVGAMDDEFGKKIGRIKVSLAKNRIQTKSSSTLDQNEWYQKILNQVVLKGEVDIDYTVQRNETNLSIRSIPSLTRFFSQLKNKSEPLIENDRHEIKNLNQDLKTMESLLNKLSTALQPAEASQAFISRIQRYLEVLKRDERLVNAKQIEDLISESHNETWERMFMVDFNSTVQLKSALNKLEEELQNK